MRNLQNPPPVNYLTSGNYSVRLVTINSSGCVDTAYKSVDAYPLPDVDAGSNTMICVGSSVELSATGALQYSWEPSTALSCTACKSPVTAPSTDITYFLTGKNIHGCTAVDSVKVDFKQPFKLLVSNGDTLCTGESLPLEASGAEEYYWSPPIGLDNTRSAYPIAKPDTSVLYRVIGKDLKSCFSDTGYVSVVVYPYPSVETGEDKTISAGSSIILKPVFSGDITTIKWQPPFGLNCITCPYPTATPKESTIYSIEVSNLGGCISRDQMKIEVFCNNSNLYLPNTFSPNGDGINDVFYPGGRGLFSINSFRVYNPVGSINLRTTKLRTQFTFKRLDRYSQREKLSPGCLCVYPRCAMRKPYCIETDWQHCFSSLTPLWYNKCID